MARENSASCKQIVACEVNIVGYKTSFNYPLHEVPSYDKYPQIAHISSYLELPDNVHFTQVLPNYTHSNAEIIQLLLNDKRTLK